MTKNTDVPVFSPELLKKSESTYVSAKNCLESDKLEVVGIFKTQLDLVETEHSKPKN